MLLWRRRADDAAPIPSRVAPAWQQASVGTRVAVHPRVVTHEHRDGRDDGRMIIDLPSDVAAACSPGALRIALGAALFALTNGFSTALYRNGGASVVGLYVLRSAVLYGTNALLVGWTNGWSEAANVLLLRCGNSEAFRIALTRSLLNAVKACLLSISFVFMTYADAFTVFKGVSTFSTVIVARVLLGAGEQLSCYELLCGTITLIGIVLIAQPPAIFGEEHTALPPPSPPPLALGLEAQDSATIALAAAWTPRVGAGLAIATLSGVLSSFSGSLMRLLSNASGPFQLSPNMTLSFLMIVMVGLFGGVALVCRATRLTEAPGWEWSAFVFPARAFDWCLVGLHCICALGAWLATGAGYATTRAGMVAFLQLTELPWVYVLDISALGEPTNALKSVGSAIVFASAVAAGCGDGRKAA